MNVLVQTKIVELSRDMRLHHDEWVMLLGTDMTMRCNVVVSSTIEHERIGSMHDQTSFDST